MPRALSATTHCCSPRGACNCRVVEIEATTALDERRLLRWGELLTRTNAQTGLARTAFLPHRSCGRLSHCLSVPAQLLSVCLLSAPPLSRLRPSLIRHPTSLLLINSPLPMIPLRLAVPSLVACADASSLLSVLNAQHPSRTAKPIQRTVLGFSPALVFSLSVSSSPRPWPWHIAAPAIVCEFSDSAVARSAPSVLLLRRMHAACLGCCAPLALRRPPACCHPTVCLCCAASPRIRARTYPTSALHSVERSLNGQPSSILSAVPANALMLDSSCNKHN